MGLQPLFSADTSGTTDGNRGRQWIYYKFSDGSESGTLTVTIGGGEVKLARMYAFRNVALSAFNEGGGFLAR